MGNLQNPHLNAAFSSAPASAFRHLAAGFPAKAKMGTVAKLKGGVGGYLPPSAPWLEEFQNEVRRFPNGAHDDQIDALSQFLDYIFGRRGSLILTTYSY